MKNILIITPRTLPVPAVDGGAVEKLVDELLIQHSLNSDTEIKFTIYTSKSPKITNEILSKYNNIEFRFIDKGRVLYKGLRVIYGIKKRIGLYNNLSNVFVDFIINDLKRRKEKEKYQLVIVENDYTSVHAIKKYIKCNVVLHMHNDYIKKDLKNIKTITNDCSKIWCVSSFIKNRVNNVNNEVETEVFYNGFDYKSFKEKLDTNIVNDIRKKYEITNEDFIVLYTGRIMKEKGVLELIRGFKLSYQKYKKIKLIIVGGSKNNKNENDSYYKKIKKEVNGWEQCIKLVGYVKYIDLVNYYKIADVQVVPSIWNEAFGLTVIEGMSMGVPVVGNNCGGITEILENIGCLVEKDNLEKNISKKIIELYEDRNLMQIISEREMENVSKYDIKKYYERFVKLIEKELI